MIDFYIIDTFKPCSKCIQNKTSNDIVTLCENCSHNMGALINLEQKYKDLQIQQKNMQEKNKQLCTMLQTIINADNKAIAAYYNLGLGEPPKEMKMLTEQARKIIEDNKQ